MNLHKNTQFTNNVTTRNIQRTKMKLSLFSISQYIQGGW